MRNWIGGAVVAGAMFAAASAQAVTIDWTDWTAGNNVAGTAVGTVGGIGVSYSGPAYNFIQTNGGTNYWTEGVPAPYTSGDVDNAPPPSDIIALSTGGTSTIAFDMPVVDPVIALVSWNGNVADFGTDIEIVSFGPGFWGNGSFGSVTPTGFTGVGELHGVIRLPGTHNSITFTHTSENWHGIQVGIEGVAVQTPEAAPLALLGVGAIALAAASRRR